MSVFSATTHCLIAIDKSTYQRKDSMKMSAIKQDLSTIPTRDLVNELQNRQGVLSTHISPYELETVDVEGPAIVLVIID